jgi:hypothetical protein
MHPNNGYLDNRFHIGMSSTSVHPSHTDLALAPAIIELVKVIGTAGRALKKLPDLLAFSPIS